MPSNCLAHGLRIKTGSVCVAAHDDRMGVPPAATTPTRRFKLRICGQDCPSLLQISAGSPLGHQPVHAPINSDPVQRVTSSNAVAPERCQLSQSPTVTSRWPLKVHVPPWSYHALQNMQHISQEYSTLLPCTLQGCSLTGLLVEVLNRRPFGARNGCPNSSGQSFLHPLAHTEHCFPQHEIMPGL